MQELKGDILSGFLFELGELYELPMVFKEATWDALVDHVSVHTDGRVVFTLRTAKRSRKRFKNIITISPKKPSNELRASLGYAPVLIESFHLTTIIIPTGGTTLTMTRQLIKKR